MDGLVVRIRALKIIIRVFAFLLAASAINYQAIAQVCSSCTSTCRSSCASCRDTRDCLRTDFRYDREAITSFLLDTVEELNNSTIKTPKEDLHPLTFRRGRHVGVSGHRIKLAKAMGIIKEGGEFTTGGFYSFSKAGPEKWAVWEL